MQVRVIQVLLVVMISGLLLPGMVTAQSDDATRDVVLQAVADTIAGGYYLKIKSNIINRITQADEFITTTYNIQNVTGDVTADGDRDLTWEIQDADALENATAAEPLVVEQIISDGVTYVNFSLEGTMYEDMLEIAPGWWEYDHLLESSSSALLTVMLQSYGRPNTPLDTLFTADTIEGVEELKPEVINDMKMRVFNIKLDALQLLLNQTVGTDEEREHMLAENQDLLAASDFSLTYLIWIGADDGLVYRGKGEGRLFIPYASEGLDNDPNIDLYTNSAFEFTILQHGVQVDITPPEILNE